MPKVTRAIGSGMTERGVVEFDWGDAKDVQGLVRAATETFERNSFDGLFRKLETLAKQILQSAELPSDPGVSYLVTPDGAWAPIDDQSYPGVELHDADLPLDLAVPFCGYPSDSAEGHAARVLMLLRKARQKQEAGSIDEAMALAFKVGELANEASIKDLFEADVITGEKVRAAGRDAHEKRYGTPEEKAARREAFQQEFDRLRAVGTKKMLAYRQIAKKFRVHSATVRRALTSRPSK